MCYEVRCRTVIVLGQIYHAAHCARCWGLKATAVLCNFWTATSGSVHRVDFRSEAATTTLREESSTRASTKSTMEECSRQTFAEACSSWHTCTGLTHTHTHHDHAYCIVLVFFFVHYLCVCHCACNSFNSKLNRSAARPSASCLRATFASSNTPTLAWSSGGQVAMTDHD